MLYFIGLGLGDEKDITLRGLEAVRRCSDVFLESYTSLLGVDKAALVRGGGGPPASRRGLASRRGRRAGWTCSPRPAARGPLWIGCE